jgi:hypothetical protein
VDEEYVVALGRAAYVFATLEWNPSVLRARLSGYVARLSKKTAGIIANDLLTLVEGIADPAI